MLLSLPTPPIEDFGQIYTIQLDGVFYKFDFRWNKRDQSWYLDIGNNRGEATIRNLRMVLGTDLLEPFRGLGQDNCPQGELSVFDTARSGVEASREDFGDRVLLTYLEVDAA